MPRPSSPQGSIIITIIVACSSAVDATETSHVAIVVVVIVRILVIFVVFLSFFGVRQLGEVREQAIQQRFGRDVELRQQFAGQSFG